MTQHAYAIADQNGLAFLADVNAALAAIVTNNSGTTEPTATFPHMWWADTTAGILKRRNAGNADWISVMSLDLAISDFGESLITAADAAAVRILLDAAQDSGLLHTADNETKSGVLTFTDSPVVPEPTAANQAANMGYVDGGTGTAITATGTTLTSAAARQFIDINSATATTTTLMAASSLLDGQSFTLTNIGAGIATFNRAGADTIAGGNLVAATSISLNQGETVTLSKVNGSFRVTSSNVSFFGVPQTWQVVTGSRASGVTYTNTSGRIRIVSAYGTINVQDSLLATISGESGVIRGPQQAVTTARVEIYFSVPIGASYSISPGSGTWTITKWSEF